MKIGIAVIALLTGVPVGAFETTQDEHQAILDGQALANGVTFDQIQIGQQGLDQGVTLITGVTADQKKAGTQLAQDGVGLLQGSGGVSAVAHDAEGLAGGVTRDQLDEGRALLNSGAQLINSVSPEQRHQFSTILSDGERLLNNPAEQQRAANLVRQSQALVQQAISQANSSH